MLGAGVYHGKNASQDMIDKVQYHSVHGLISVNSLLITHFTSLLLPFPFTLHYCQVIPPALSH